MPVSKQDLLPLAPTPARIPQSQPASDPALNAQNNSADVTISDITNGIQGITVADGNPLVDCEDQVRAAIAEIKDLTVSVPSLYLDIEGIRVSRQGSVSILQMYAAPLDKTYLFDVHTLGIATFDTIDETGTSLRDLLEASAIPKVFFDVRNDSDALYSHFDVKLAGVIDIQVLEYATRTSRTKFVNGLARCMERDLQMTASQRLEWQQVKEKGKQLFTPEKGGDYEVFNQRPLQPEILKYCVEDVRWLPELYRRYNGRLNPNMRRRVEFETLKRVSESQSSSYNGHGKHKAVGPW